MKTTTPKRSLVTAADLETLCTAALGTKKNDDGEAVPVTENAQQFADYIRVMALCGARRNEALGLQWSDVDFENNQLCLRRQITSRGTDGIEPLKNREARAINMNPKLRAHLKDMQKRSGRRIAMAFPITAEGRQRHSGQNVSRITGPCQACGQDAEIQLSRLPASLHLHVCDERD